VGGFLYVTLGSIGAGVIVSTLRWAILDRLHHWTGIHEPAWDFSRFPEKVWAFERLVAYHYKYYEFHGNTLVAVVLAYLARWISQGIWPAELDATDLGFLFLGFVLWAGSRDNLQKYYMRAGQLFSPSAPEKSYDQRMLSQAAHRAPVCRQEAANHQAAQARRERRQPRER
jgi:hypothetical protein